MSAPNPERAGSMPRKRRASVALSPLHSPSGASKLSKNGDSADPDVPPPPTAISDSASSDMGDAELDESGPEELESCDPSLEDAEEEDEYADYSEPESVWSESDGIESESEIQRNPHPIDNPSTSALKLRTKLVGDCEFGWCEDVVAEVTHSENTPNAKVIGRASAKLIKRGHIRPAFHEAMEALSQDASELAFDLFDQYGYLRRELIEHCIKKGTGVWGDEVSSGDILLLERVRVDKGWRRQGIGSKLVMAVWQKAQEKHDVRFSFVWATHLNDEARLTLGKSKAERNAIFDEGESVAIALYRSIGYRRVGSSVWFCFAADASHASHNLAPIDDYNPPKYQSDELDVEGITCEDGDTAEARRMARLQQIRPLHHAITVLADNDCVEFLSQQRAVDPTSSASWEAVDDCGNTILHLAAIMMKFSSLDWIMESGLETKLITYRNYEGYTPLEALQSLLESTRVKKELLGNSVIRPASDDFRGFTDEAVRCLLRLMDISNPTTEELARVKYGCTCGECIEGFLSPRMSLALVYQAEITYDMFRGERDIIGDDPNTWCDLYGSWTRYVHPSVRDNLRANESMRLGFVRMYLHIAKCLHCKSVPTEHNVVRVMLEHSESSPHSKGFLQRGGRVSDALSQIFDSAVADDEKAGSGEFREVMEDEVRQLRNCRNDHEFGFV